MKLLQKIRRNDEMSASFKKRVDETMRSQDETEITESMGDSCGELFIKESTIALPNASNLKSKFLELAHETREKSQQVEMLRQTLSVVKSTMTRNDVILQTKVKQLEEKTLECEQLKVKCEGLVREKATAVAMWKFKYEALIAEQESKDEKKKSDRRNSTPSPPTMDSLLGNRPWRQKNQHSPFILPNRPCSSLEDSDDRLDSDEDSISAGNPLDAVCRGARTNRTRRYKRKSKKDTEKEVPAFKTVSMEWIGRQAIKPIKDARDDEEEEDRDVNEEEDVNVNEEEDIDVNKEENELESNIDTHSIEEIDITLCDEPGLGKSSLSREEDIAFEEAFEADSDDDGQESGSDESSITMDDSSTGSLTSSNETEKCTSGSSKEENQQHQVESPTPKGDANNDDDNNVTSFQPLPEATTDINLLINNKNEQVEEEYEQPALPQEDVVDSDTDDDDDDDDSVVVVDKDETMDGFVSEKEQKKDTSSSDEAPVFDKELARRMRRRVRRRARIARRAVMEARATGFDMQQLEC